MNAHRICGELEAGTYAIGALFAGAMNQGLANARTARAEGEAVDSRIAGAITGAAAHAHARVAGDVTAKLVFAEAEISRLNRIIDGLRGERSDLIAVAGDLLSEVETLRRH